MSHELPVTEGYLSFAGYRTWYRVTGEREEPGKFPLLCLHGGPGVTWHQMEPYTELAADGRRVICYDQLGCGNSAVTEPHETSMWTTELYLAEVAAIRKELGLDQCHVLGHSWGGMLGMAYAITKPPGLVSLLAQGAPASVPFAVAEIDKLRAELPPEAEEILRRHEAAGTTDSEEYENTTTVFTDRHLCRVKPPDWLERSFAAIEANPEVYLTMWGPSEFHASGTLKDFDITAELGAIEAPALLFCGEFDEVTPAAMAQAHTGIPGSQFIVLPGCSHMAHAERPDLTLGLVRGWLAGVEASLRRLPRTSLA